MNLFDSTLDSNHLFMKIKLHLDHMKIRGNITFYSLFSNLKRGLQALSHIKWVSSSGTHISVASVLGIAGLILATRDGKMGNFSSLLRSSGKISSAEKLLYVPGLQNLGNNCFLNVVLQALASCSSFQPFLERVVAEVHPEIDDFPFLVTLAPLLEELCTVRDTKAVLSPRKVMSAMDRYIPNFNLTNQQDAAEALLHILSCLREEISESYVQNHGSLADVAGPSCRIHTLTSGLGEPKRWQQQHLGPFNGILGSVLACQSCSSEIIMDFELFHTLPLSIVNGCTIEECMKRYMTAERVEDYHCSHCWHLAAIKYLSTIGGYEEEINELRCCGEDESCCCRNFSRLQTLPWSNRFSRTFKQLSIIRNPKIICLHLQRVSMNIFGELVKSQGHISFPLTLNLSPFVKGHFGTKEWEDKLQGSLPKQPHLSPTSYPHDMYPSAHMLKLLTAVAGQNIYSKAVDRQSQSAPARPENVIITQPVDEWSLYAGETCSRTNPLHTSQNIKASENHMYRLVSVVEHFGRARGGHYTVYRRGRTDFEDESYTDHSDNPSLQWYSISDSEVHHASEKDVLAADASLLFYERIKEE